jgi:hypothetical protein
MRIFVRAVVALAVVVPVVVTTTSLRAQELARAQEPPPPQTAIGLDLGVGSAVGFAGVTLVRAFGQHVQIELGTGVGLSGYQFSLMPKIVLGSPYSHFVAGLGLSVASPTRADQETGHPVWLNVDAIGYEFVSRLGLAFLVTAGVTKGLGGGTLCTQIDGCEPGEKLDDVATLWSPQFRVGYAYWF